jgi:hypothetical protein
MDTILRTLGVVALVVFCVASTLMLTTILQALGIVALVVFCVAFWAGVKPTRPGPSTDVDGILEQVRETIEAEYLRAKARGVSDPVIVFHTVGERRTARLDAVAERTVAADAMLRFSSVCAAHLASPAPRGQFNVLLLDWHLAHRRLWPIPPA